MLGTTKWHRGLYVIDISDVHSTSNYVTSNSFKLWHLRLGHLSNFSMKTMAKHFPPIPCKNNMNLCDSFHFAKQKKFPFPNSLTHTHAPFELLHVDLWGPFSTDSILG